MSTPDDKLQTLLQSAKTGKRWKTGRTIAGVALLTLLAAFIVATLVSGKPRPGSYTTSEATPGELVVTVSASGTLQPTKSVDVGSELSGTLEAVLAQENEQVKKGQVLARLDLSKLRDQVIKSQAAVASAEASVAQMQATVAETRANLARLREVEKLSGGKVPAKSELDTAAATLQRAEANEAVARAAVTQARATLKSDETNVDKATIRSPIDGVVLTRKVEPGQTVVAAMTTPVLFVLAEDLTRMELQVKVDEADVAGVRVGQPAAFTVSAWPGRRFPATLERVGLGSTTTDNVVTYKTILKVGNDELVLRPGMTATADITTARRANALLVPNAALRFTPPQNTPAAAGGGLVASLIPKPPPAAAPHSRTQAGKGESQVWVLDNGEPQQVRVETGVSNGRFTEIVGGELKVGMAVITDYQESAK